jgi:preprotein translocase subunit YajC
MKLYDVFVPIMVMFCVVVFVCEQYDKQQKKAKRLEKQLEECDVRARNAHKLEKNHA